MRYVLLILSVISVSFIWAAEDKCTDYSAEFTESGYFRCLEDCENVSSFYKCLYHEDLRKGRTDKDGIKYEFTTIGLKQQECIYFLRNEGITKEQSIDKIFSSIMNRRYYVGPKLKKVFLFSNDTVDVVKNDDYLCYLNYLKSLECDLSSSACKDWHLMIERELAIHRQIPVNCYCLMEEHKANYTCHTALDYPWLPPDKWLPAYENMIVKGADQFKNECNEYNVSKSVATMIKDSLEDYFWASAKNHKQYKSYLNSFPSGKYKEEAEVKLRENFITVSEFIKDIERKYENGESLNSLTAMINKYQDEYNQKGNDTLNAYVQKYALLKDSIESIATEWQKNFSRGNYSNLLCSFTTNKNTYSVDKDDLTKLPEKNGHLSCYYPLSQYKGEMSYHLYDEDRDEESVFAIVKFEADIVNRKIAKGMEEGFNPKLEMVYKNKISQGTENGIIRLNWSVEISFDSKSYKIKINDDEKKNLEWTEVRNVFYLLSKNKNKVKHLNLLSIYNANGEADFQPVLKNGKIQSMALKSESQTVFMPLNNMGNIDGTIKYWDSDIGNVEITINGNINKRFDEKGKSKVEKVKMAGCTFTPPRKVVGYRKTAGKSKYPIYEKFSNHCESVASDTGMELLLSSIGSYRARLNEFIPLFLVRYLDWNNME